MGVCKPHIPRVCLLSSRPIGKKAVIVNTKSVQHSVGRMLCGVSTYPADESKYQLGDRMVVEATPEYHCVNCGVFIPLKVDCLTGTRALGPKFRNTNLERFKVVGVGLTWADFFRAGHTEVCQAGEGGDVDWLDVF